MSNNNKSLSIGGVYYLIYNVLNMAFPFVSGIYVARKLLPNSIGMVSAAQNLSQYFMILAFLGIPTYGLREISKARSNREERNKVFSELYIISILSTITFSLLYLFLVLIVPEYKNHLSLYLVVGLSIALNVFNISWLYEGLEEFKFISIRNLLIKALAFLCLILLVRKPDDYLKYAMINVIGVAGNYFLNIAYAPRFVSFTLNDLHFTRHLRPIFYLVAVNLAIEIYSLMDVTMMNFLSSNESIAYYKYGNTIYKMLLQVVNTFTMVLVPRISLYYKENNFHDFNRLVSKGLKLIIIFAVPMIIGILFTSKFLVVELYGENYSNSAIILNMFSVLLLISPIGYLLGSRILLVTNHEKQMMISVVVGALVNLVCNYCLIPVYDEFGATVSSVISELVMMVAYVFMGKKYFRLIGISNTSIKVVLSALIMTLFLLICRVVLSEGWLLLILQVGGSLLIYPCALIILKEEILFGYWNTFISKYSFLKH